MTNVLSYKVRDLPQVDRRFAFKPVFKENEFIGLEFEIEGYNLPAQEDFKFHWQVKEDGSLRRPAKKPRGRAYEYISDRPRHPDYFKTKCFPYLLKKIAAAEAEPVWSVRCSTHVHVGVHELYLYQVFAMVGLYYIIEDLLYPLIGQNRNGNLFCVSAGCSETLVDVLTKTAETGKMGFCLDTEQYKYSAVNLLSLKTFGTVEFRGMEGTLDKERVFAWIDILHAIRTYAHNLRPEDVGNLLNQMSFNGVVNTLKAILGGADSQAYQYIYQSFGGNEEIISSLMYVGIGRVQSLFYEPHWEKIEPVEKLEVPASPIKRRTNTDLLMAQVHNYYDTQNMHWNGSTQFSTQSALSQAMAAAALQQPSGAAHVTSIITDDEEVDDL